MSEQNRIEIELNQAIARYGVPSILLADDSLTQQFVIKAVLQNVGLSVDCVDDGEKALSQIKHKQYDIVLMDIQMPILDGISATQQIRQFSPLGVLPIIALTGDTELNALSPDKTALFNAFLQKPVESHLLIDTIISFWVPQQDVSSIHHQQIALASDNQHLVNSIAQLAQHPSFDLSGGVYEWVGDAAYLRVLSAFIRVYEPYVSSLDLAGYQGLSHVEQHRFFHKLNSAAANIGAIDLMNAIEQFQQNSDVSIHQVNNELRRVIDMLKPLNSINKK